MTATIDEVAKTLGEFEALAQGTGQWDGADPVEFSADGVTWLPVWVATDDRPFPTFARATVHRKGVAAPTVMIVAWAESVPADDEWRALWERKPMKLFGSFALRSAIRHAFRDVVGDLRGPDEDTTGPTVDQPARDWRAEYLAAETLAQLDDIRYAVREARQNTDPLNALYRERKAELAARAWEPVTSQRAAEVLTVGAQIAPVLDEMIAEAKAAEPIAFDPPLTDAEADAFLDAVTGQPKPGRAPQDHLPGNRAARRAASKKGRRRG